MLSTMELYFLGYCIVGTVTTVTILYMLVTSHVAKFTNSITKQIKSFSEEYQPKDVIVRISGHTNRMDIEATMMIAPEALISVEELKIFFLFRPGWERRTLGAILSRWARPFSHGRGARLGRAHAARALCQSDNSVIEKS